jgi:isoleucyl-tRNA synthetase
MSDNKPKTIQQKEEETLLFWQKNNIFEQSVANPAGGEAQGNFSFYDGPPFATGLPHMGHILAGTIKDAIPRYQTMKGKHVRRTWGWDCHGLPIENLIEKKLELKSKKDIEEYGIDKFNHEAYCSVLTYDNEWKSVIPRFGRFVDMEHPYKTMDATYTESIWWAWKTLHEKGLAYEGHKMMHICPRCETTLAQSEVGMNYEDVTDISVTAKFELADEPGTYVLAWTTTPWTLPGNTALAINKNANYVKISLNEGANQGKFILAHELLPKVILGNDYDFLGEFKGEELLGKKYKPLFPYFVNAELENKEHIWKIWHADFITLDTGTGVAHQAPAFGQEDMDLAKANNIPVIKHVHMDGTFTKDVTDFAGMKVKQAGDTQSADIEIIKWLAHAGFLFEKHKIIHSYPLCWRCKTPLLNYATSSWFVDVPKMKPTLISENKNIGWVPEHIRDGRFGKWLEGAHEWAVSRARYWGAPLPVWKCAECDEMKMIGSLKELAEGKKAKNTYYVMRHGQSESNVAGIIDCDGDHANGLTELGKEQAHKAGEALKDKNIDFIVCSPFLRTKMTAEAVAQELGDIKIIEDERLKEFNLGVYDKRKIEDYLKEVGELRYLKLDTRVEGGETHREMMNRAVAAWMDLEKTYEGKNILIVTHGGPSRMLLVGLQLITEEELIDDESKDDTVFYPKNAEVRKIEPYIVPRDATGAVNLHRPYIDEATITCACGKEMKRIPDVFDCWFESGAMPFASVHYPFENKKLFDASYPADFIAEGIDQTRGWFYSLINLGVGLFGKAPYKHVIVNGLVLAESGKKLSKSEANYTDPIELVNKYGADSVRYFLLSSPAVKGESVLFSDKGVDEVYKKLILRLENVVSLYDMNKEEGIVARATSNNLLDRWIVSRMHEVIAQATKGYDTYVIDDATRPLEKFIDDLSVWYVRRSRSRLKGDEGVEAKKEALTTLSYVLLNTSYVLAPVMPFIAERVYASIKETSDAPCASVHLAHWPKGGDVDTSVTEEMEKVREVVSLALMVRMKENISVRQPLSLLKTNTLIDRKFYDLILDEVNVKKIESDNTFPEKIYLDTTLTDELVREGDVRHLIRAVQDRRKEMNLSPKDEISLTLHSAVDLGNVDELKKVCNIKDVRIVSEEQETEAMLSFGRVSFTVTA